MLDPKSPQIIKKNHAMQTRKRKRAEERKHDTSVMTSPRRLPPPFLEALRANAELWCLPGEELLDPSQPLLATNVVSSAFQARAQKSHKPYHSSKYPSVSPSKRAKVDMKHTAKSIPSRRDLDHGKSGLGTAIALNESEIRKMAERLMGLERKEADRRLRRNEYQKMFRARKRKQKVESQQAAKEEWGPEHRAVASLQERIAEVESQKGEDSEGTEHKRDGKRRQMALSTDEQLSTTRYHVCVSNNVHGKQVALDCEPNAKSDDLKEAARRLRLMHMQETEETRLNTDSEAGEDVSISPRLFGKRYAYCFPSCMRS